MFSKMSAFTVGLVAALYATDVNAVVYETCQFSAADCKDDASGNRAPPKGEPIAGTCKGGLAQEGVDTDDYTAMQAGYYGVGPKDYKTCDAYAKGYYAKMKEMYANDGDEPFPYSEADMLKETTAFAGCVENEDGEFYAQRCGASFTGSSMAALFGLLCVSLALW